MNKATIMLSTCFIAKVPSYWASYKDKSDISKNSTNLSIKILLQMNQLNVMQLQMIQAMIQEIIDEEMIVQLMSHVL